MLIITEKTEFVLEKHCY